MADSNGYVDLNRNHSSRDIIAPMSCPYWPLALSWVALAVPLCAQPPAKKTAPQAKSDTWERSKECAAQSEKLVSEYDKDGQARGFPKTVWQNHYSAKYARCFLKIFSTPTSRRMMTLQDPFERSTVAVWDLENSYCEIESEKADCGMVFDFIADHMKN
jgi:hypothetical protein